ncbi:Uu.00g121290.m01.CDS01 [Anthostomella pinea]|uniref:Uu.00g121290.m01.CDS01 n=1 Tax=Anthostomella pinea TaxID=933095 RepID=A0AAI8VHY4_9PEZI|nr:Uu.00g121290.m01.CDS01 [Anthostomella pinea]
MDYIVPTFKWVSVTFAFLAVGTGAQAVIDPVGFSKTFGLSLEPTSLPKDDDNGARGKTNGSKNGSRSDQQYRSLAESYASLMGVRQLGTGIILLTFAYQGKWTETATIMAIIGVLVAGTDGIFLARAGYGSLGRWHAIPGAGMAALGAAAVYIGT